MWLSPDLSEKWLSFGQEPIRQLFGGVPAPSDGQDAVGQRGFRIGTKRVHTGDVLNRQNPWRVLIST